MFNLPHQKSPNLTKFLITAIFLTSVTAFSTATQAASLSDLFGGATSSQSDPKKPLPVNQAFQVVPTQHGNQLSVQINITDGYYAYKDKLKLELPAGVTATPFSFNQTPNFVNDPDFGRVPVFEQTVTATTTLTSSKAIDNQPAIVKWQGCAKAGLCYPPEKVKFTIQNLSAQTSSSQSGLSQSGSSQPTASVVSADKPSTTIKKTVADNASAVSQTANQTLSQTSNQNTIASSTLDKTLASQTAVTTNQSASTASVATNVPTVTSNTNAIVANSNASSTLSANSSAVNSTLNTAEQDTFGLKKHTGLALLLLFLAGLGLAFTPCVLPMLPIVANIVARQHNPSAKKGLLLTGSYGLGVATSYGILGAIVAVFGQSLGLMNMLQNPAILLGFALLFVLLGLYMMDWLPIRLPARLSQKLQNVGQIGESRLGSITGSFITGFFSALVVSPCVSAPLAGAVAGVAAVGNPIIGFLALFLLGLGLSTPLILLGATQGNFMPKAGEWMNWVKKGFALMLFAVALLMIERVWVSPFMLLLWAVWFAVVAVWAWQWVGRGQLLTRAIALVLSGWMLCLLAGVATGSTDSWQPLKAFNEKQTISQNTSLNKNQPNATHDNAITVKSLAELQPLLSQYPNVLVDVTADWCIECRIMDKTLFANPPAQLAKWQVVRLDVTENSDNSKAVYQTLQVFGPPVLLYYQNGKLVARQNGETKRADFEAQLNQLNY